MEKENSLITQDESIFKSTNRETFCTMNLDDEDNKLSLYNSLQGCDVRLNDIKGTVLSVVEVFIEKKEVAERDEKTDEIIYDEETGEVKTKIKYRTILFDDEGKTYVSSAYGIYNSLRQIISIFGNPSKDNIIKVKVGTKKLNNGKESLILTVVRSSRSSI